eukprot:TRINITY_DN4534_c0_g2_i1.p1 TRINITY_DN4534_c0_g2~~TRINITY_DN4534_c0_g2_i1.p1  ORF type:complete len:503 (+),score=61.92 TRINITY_DN4534_c0_g2_i1:72-1580(+)
MNTLLLNDRATNDYRLSRKEKLFLGLMIPIIIALGLICFGVLIGTLSTPFSKTDLCPFVNEIEAVRKNITGMYAENRHRLIRRLTSPGAVYLEGNKIASRNDDVEQLFRQESNFIYMSGVDMPDTDLLVFPNGTAALFVSRPNLEDAVWVGRLRTKEEIASLYEVDFAYYHDEFPQVLSSLNPNLVYILNSGVNFPGKTNYRIDYTTLPRTLNEVRVVKSDKEIALLGLVARIASHAHLLTMKRVATRAISTEPLYEYDIESYFLYICYNCGLRQQSYLPIVASGPNSAVLHYNINNRKITSKDMLLIDAGAEFGIYGGYGSDITRSYPVSGIFTVKQEVVYQMVLNVQNRILEMLKPGLVYSDVVAQVKNATAWELLENGFVQGNLTDILFYNITTIFLPHGACHYLGIDVHDGDRINLNTPLEKGMYITVEPGIYFNNVSLSIAYNNTALNSFLVKEKIDDYRDIGGVRIEDDVLITEDGYKILSDVPREREQIERAMKF